MNSSQEKKKILHIINTSLKLQKLSGNKPFFS